MYFYLTEVSVKTSLVPNRTIVAGENFKLRCAVGVFGYTMKWMRNGATIGVTTSMAFDFLVARADETDEGDFTCIVQSGGCTARSTIVVNIEGTMT